MKYLRLKDLRDDAEKKQSEVAKDLGLYTTTYARYERGEQDLPLDIAIAIAKYYDVSLDYLAGLTNSPKDKTI